MFIVAVLGVLPSAWGIQTTALYALAKKDAGLWGRTSLKHYEPQHKEQERFLVASLRAPTLCLQTRKLIAHFTLNMLDRTSLETPQLLYCKRTILLIP